VHLLGDAAWSRRGYREFAEQGYCRNVIAHRSVQLVAQAAGSLRLQAFRDGRKGRESVLSCPLLTLAEHPSPVQTGRALLHDMTASLLIGGNVFLLAVRTGEGSVPRELHLLRQDRVSIVPGPGNVPAAYVYRAGEKERRWDVRPTTGESDVVHIKRYHPLDDWFGLSSAEAASYAIDQHNQAAAWNQALLQNGARPSGALVVGGGGDGGGYLPDEQYRRLKDQLDECHTGAANAGRPMILEGGLDWREMSISPRDMEFIEAKHSAARDVALAFGVPPQLLGIPGDNTYSNLAEARLALWEQTVIPLAQDMLSAVNARIAPMFGDGAKLDFRYDDVSALSPRRDALWSRIGAASFLTDEEKRRMLGV
jgi:HK97 family phage portal protein